MKIHFYFFILLVFGQYASAQDQNIGIITSPRGGIVTGNLNPAEFSNMRSKFEIGIIGIEATISNDRINFLDESDKTNEQMVINFFKGNQAANLNGNATINYPSFAMKTKKWGFGFNMQSHATSAILNAGYNVSDFKLNSTVNNTILSAAIQTNDNAKFTIATWSEMNLSTSRVLFEDDKNRINAGVTVKVLFPAIYANIGLDKAQGTVEYREDKIDLNADNKVYISNINNTKMNIDYSGSLVDGSSSFFGSMNGFGADIGLNYQLKDENPSAFYKLNTGISIKNIGSMTYQSKAGENSFSTYNLNTTTNALDIDAAFKGKNFSNLDEITSNLENTGNLSVLERKSKRKVQLPTIIALYGDFKIVSRFYTSVYVQHKIGDPTVDYIIPSQNIVAITPRYAAKYFEVYSTMSSYEISGFNAGLGFRIGGFYIGSNSLITALSTGKQIGFNTGVRWAFGE